MIIRRIVGGMNIKLKVKLFSITLIIFLLISGIPVLIDIGSEHSTVTAATITVDDSGGAMYTTIWDAVVAANPGDTIRVYAGTYQGCMIQKSLTIIGDGYESTIIDGLGVYDVLQFFSDWINITGFTIQNSAKDTLKGGIHCYGVDNCHIYDNKIISNQNGIILWDSSSNTIENNIISSNIEDGVCIWSYDDISAGNKILNNTLSNNQYGIYSADSRDTTIIKNTCSYNSEEGISIIDSTCDKVNNNICSDNEEGIYLHGGSLQTVNDNICTNNDRGIILFDTSIIIFDNNTCNSNNDNGIETWTLSNMALTNNTCNFNTGSGIELWNSNNLNLINNTCNSNSENGLDIQESSSITALENIFNSNWNGVLMEESSNNKILHNYCDSNNNSAIFLKFSEDNLISNNTFKDSTYGIWLSWTNIFNQIYHNNILYNNIQVKVENNLGIDWDNGEGQGNYWSDYTGSDDGTGGRVKGDGIGDTKIPHLDLDNYPFIDESGWLYPEIPILMGPKDVVTDGNYEVSWQETKRTKGYILEEDENIDFDSPITIYTGTDLDFEVNQKTNGTYFYRVKAFNDDFESKWSNTVEIIVDFPPNIPSNFTISVFPEGNTLNLSWDLNLVDTKEYELHYKSSGSWDVLDTIIHPIHTYNHTNLNDGMGYSYKLRAVDFRGQYSEYTDVIFAKPSDTVVPAAPTGLRIGSVNIISLQLKWDSNQEIDLQGYNIYKSEKLKFVGEKDPIGNVHEGDNDYIDADFDPSEINYYAVTALDEVPNESNLSNIILAPHLPEINNTLDDFNIPEDSYDDTSINLFHWFKDINNDDLEFSWEGNEHIDVTIFQENGTVILKPEENWNGQETLIFFADDGTFDKVSDEVIVTVTAVNDPPGQVEITKPLDGIRINDGISINFSCTCNDPDLDYGDILTYTWSSNISGKIGNKDQLEDVSLPIGVHLLTLVVTDSKGEASRATINVTILETPESDSDGDGMPNVWERMHGLDPNDPADAKKDIDGDGTSNLEEYRDGTDPNVEDSSEMDDIYIFLIIAIIIIVMIVVLVYLFIIKPRRSKNGKCITTANESIQSPYPQQQYPSQQPRQQHPASEPQQLRQQQYPIQQQPRPNQSQKPLQQYPQPSQQQSGRRPPRRFGTLRPRPPPPKPMKKRDVIKWED
jgi:parallel beta-helix repeat protein